MNPLLKQLHALPLPSTKNTKNAFTCESRAAFHAERIVTGIHSFSTACLKQCCSDKKGACWLFVDHGQPQFCNNGQTSLPVQLSHCLQRALTPKMHPSVVFSSINLHDKEMTFRHDETDPHTLTDPCNNGHFPLTENEYYITRHDCSLGGTPNKISPRWQQYLSKRGDSRAHSQRGTE